MLRCAFRLDASSCWSLLAVRSISTRLRFCAIVALGSLAVKGVPNVEGKRYLKVEEVAAECSPTCSRRDIQCYLAGIDVILAKDGGRYISKVLAGQHTQGRYFKQMPGRVS